MTEPPNGTSLLDRAQLRSLLAEQPRVSLASLPTPVQEARRLREVIGGPRLLIKRDDLTGPAFGGNKTRNLEFRMVHPVSARATLLVMALEITSNSARQTVAAANVLGMRTVLVLKGEPPGELQGNLLVNELLGAEVHYVRDEQQQLAVIEAVVGEATRLGERPMVLTSEPIFDVGSALAYAECSIELLDQLDALDVRPDYLYMTSGGKGQAGLVLAQKLLGARYVVHGVTVSYEYDVAPRTARIANDALSHLGLDARIAPDDVISFADHVGPGYGHVTEAALEAMALLARTEGIMLDPIYNGKSFACYLDHVAEGRFADDDAVVFIHTGGTPAIFSHATALLEHLRTHPDPISAARGRRHAPPTPATAS